MSGTKRGGGEEEERKKDKKENRGALTRALASQVKKKP
jgi:hypothetical protein